MVVNLNRKGGTVILNSMITIINPIYAIVIAIEKDIINSRLYDYLKILKDFCTSIFSENKKKGLPNSNNESQAQDASNNDSKVRVDKK